MFYGIPPERAVEVQDAIKVLAGNFPTIFAADMLITLDRNLGFRDDTAFMQAFTAEAMTDQEQSLTWRLHVLCWCAENGLRRNGDFVECGVYRGFCTRVASRYLDFSRRAKQWYLYDTFSGIPEDQLNPGHSNPPAYGKPGLYEFCRDSFARYPNIHVIRGRVPEILGERAPQEVAFLHLDMNSADAESGALEFFFERLSPGAFVLLDDYGARYYREQKLVADEFFGERGYRVMELPTGQGIMVK